MRSVIMFHGIQPEPSVLTVTKDELASMLTALVDNGYAVRSIPEVMSARPEDKVVALTFDDGFASVKVAAEVLADFGVTATLFVVTGWVGKTNRWPGQAKGMPAQRLLTWDELATLKTAGWALQPHSHNHPDLRQLPDKNLVREIDASCEAMKNRLGVEPELFAYPYGYVNERVHAHVRECFDYAVTTMLSDAPAGTDPHLVPRIDAYYLWPKPVHFYYGRQRFKAYLKTRQQLRRWKGHPGEPIVDWMS